MKDYFQETLNQHYLYQEKPDFVLCTALVNTSFCGFQPQHCHSQPWLHIRITWGAFKTLISKPLATEFLT